MSRVRWHRGTLPHLTLQRCLGCDERLRLVREQVLLTVCPLSNLALCVVDDMAGHNLKRLIDRGVEVTVNSDDPTYFGGYIADNYLATADALGLARDDLILCARNSLEASFATQSHIDTWLAELDSHPA